MSQQLKFVRIPLSIVCQFSLLLQGVVWIPSVGFIAGEGVRAQTPLDAIDDFGDAELAPPPPAAEPTLQSPGSAQQLQPLREASADPPPGELEPAAEADYATEPPASPSAAVPDPMDSTGVAPWKPRNQDRAAPEAIAAPGDIAPPEADTTPVRANAAVPLREVHQNNLYRDRTDYSVGATESEPSVSANEAPALNPPTDSTPAQTVARPQADPDPLGVPAAPPPPPPVREVVQEDWTPQAPHQDVSVPSEAHVYDGESEEVPPASILEAQQQNLYRQPQPPSPEPVAAPEPYAPEPAPAYASLPEVPVKQELEPINVGPVQVGDGGIHFRTKAAARNFDLKRLSRPAGRPGNGDRSMIFPLAIPAQITSLFGWRVHPIFGDRRFHSGTDLGAPLGTPVLAAYSGTVAIADWLGGYGKTVVIEHEDATTETLYAHLSEILVEPGQFVAQGEAIARLGSTGNSTGPHLHFELRELTPEGWVNLDPGTQLEYALSTLIQSLEMAAPLPEVPTPEGSPLATLPSLDMPAPPPPQSFLSPNTRVATTLEVPAPPPVASPEIPIFREISVPANLEPPPEVDSPSS